MNKMTSAPRNTRSPFGQMLRQWRLHRGLSQLALANAANTTPRHLSFIETGRSRPKREMVLRLAETLALSLRDQNRLLECAGFAPAYAHKGEVSLDRHPMGLVIQTILDRHAPYPALVLDRLGRVLMANQPVLAMFPEITKQTPEAMIDRFYGDPRERARYANWPEMAAHGLARMRAKLANDPDPDLDRLYQRALRICDGLLSGADAAHVAVPATDIISPIFCVDGQHIHTITTVMRFDTAREVTLSELCIELVYPADDDADAFFHHMAAAFP